MSTLDELLVRPFGADELGKREPNHVDLRESQSFYDWETGKDDFDLALTAFEADRAQLARLLVDRYGLPERKNIQPYFDTEVSLNEPGSSLFEYLTGWFFEIELWRVGSRGIVVQVGHYDKELPLQLMMVVGDTYAGRNRRVGCIVWTAVGQSHTRRRTAKPAGVSSTTLTSVVPVPPRWRAVLCAVTMARAGDRDRSGSLVSIDVFVLALVRCREHEELDRTAD